MTERDNQKILIAYRLTQAMETLEEAIFLLEGGKSLRAVTNRAYYSMFYAILALMIDEPFTSSKHSGVLSYFNRRFIRERIFPEEIGRAINRAFELRQQGDYRENVELTREQVIPLIEAATTFLEMVKAYIPKKQAQQSASELRQ
ncbi:MAG: HEPN domain-containing protein [Syntrophales bacterium]